MAEISPELARKIQDLQGRYEQNPGRFFVALANAYRDAGDVEAAEQIVRDNLKRHSGPLSAHVVLGRCLADRGAHPEATSEFRYVLSIDPQNLIALRTLGEMAVRDGDSADAERWYRELLSVDPMNQEARQALETLGAAGPAGAEQAPDAGGAYTFGEQEPRAPEGFGGADVDLEDAAAGSGDAFEFGSVDLGAEPGPGVETDAASPAAFDDLGGWGEISLDASSGADEEERAGGEDLSHEEDVSYGEVELDVSGAGWEEEEPRAEGPGLDAGAGDLDLSDDGFAAGPPPLPEEGDEDAAPVTDTMAELYARQGLLARAAETYRELIRRRGETPERARRLAELEARVAEEGTEVAPASPADAEFDASRPESRLPGVEDLPVLETGLVGGGYDLEMADEGAEEFGALDLGAPSSDEEAGSDEADREEWFVAEEETYEEYVSVDEFGEETVASDAEAPEVTGTSGGHDDFEDVAEPAEEPVSAFASDVGGWDSAGSSPVPDVSAATPVETDDAFADSFAYGFGDAVPAAAQAVEEEPSAAYSAAETGEVVETEAPVEEEYAAVAEVEPEPEPYADVASEAGIDAAAHEEEIEAEAPLPVEAAPPPLPVESPEPTPPVRTFGGYLSSLLDWRPGAASAAPSVEDAETEQPPAEPSPSLGDVASAETEAFASSFDAGTGMEPAEEAETFGWTTEAAAEAPSSGATDEAAAPETLQPTDAEPDAFASGGTVEYEPRADEAEPAPGDEDDDLGLEPLPWLAGPDEVAGEEPAAEPPTDAAAGTEEAGATEPMPWEVGIDLPAEEQASAGTAPAEEPAAAEEPLPWELPAGESEAPSEPAASDAEEAAQPASDFSFDDFFAGAPPAEQAAPEPEEPAGAAPRADTPPPAEPAPPADAERSGAAEGDDEDLESFQAWLRSLKR